MGWLYLEVSCVVVVGGGWLVWAGFYLEVSCVDEDGGAWLVWASFTWKCPVLIRMKEPGW